MKRPSYLGRLGLLISAFVVLAFATKAVVDQERLARYTPVVIFHGVLMLVWVGLFAVQATLMSSGASERHRQLGRMSWILVVFMITTSFYVSYSLMVEFQFTQIFIGNMFALTQFSAFFVAALLCIGKGDGASHKRFMLFATLSMLGPAFGRVADVFFQKRVLCAADANCNSHSASCDVRPVA